MGIKKPKGDGPNEYQSYQGPTGIIYICVCVSINVCGSSSLWLTLQQNLMSQDKFSSKGG